jgi:hypothetical protein
MKTGETILKKKTGEILSMIEGEEDNGGTRQVYQSHTSATAAFSAPSLSHCIHGDAYGDRGVA